MYKVKSKDVTYEVISLDEAMKYAKKLGVLVTIEGGGIEIVGHFGADEVKDGTLPSGEKYSWYKRRYVKE